MIKSSCRECVTNWTRDQETVEYGLELLERDKDLRASDRLVVFLHGLNSRPEDLRAIVGETRRRAGHALCHLPLSERPATP